MSHRRLNSVVKAMKDLADSRNLDLVLERYASLNPDIGAVVCPDRFPPAIFAVAST